MASSSVQPDSSLSSDSSLYQTGVENATLLLQVLFPFTFLSSQPTWLLISTTILASLVTLAMSSLVFAYLQYRPLAAIPSVPFLSYIRGHCMTDMTLHSSMCYYRKFLDEFRKKGPIGRFNLFFFYPVIVASDHEGVKALLSNTDSKTDLYKAFEGWIGGGMILVPGGTNWLRKRKLLTPAFHFDVLRDYTTIFHRSTRTLLEKFRDMSEKSALPDRSLVLDIYPHMTNFSLDNVMQCVFSKETNCQLINSSNSTDSREVNEYLSAVHNLTSSFIKRMTTLIYYFDVLFYLSPAGQRFRRDVKSCWIYSKRVIAARRAAMQSSQETTSRSHNRGHLDFVDILLRCRDENGQPMDEDEIIREVNTFMFAGHDTTASAMTWLLLHLASSQAIQETCRQEVKNLFEENKAVQSGSGEAFTYDQLMNKMPYLSACLKETLRLCPSVPWFSRRVDKPIRLNDGLVIPAGTTTMVGASLLHYDQNVFPEPYIFRPERFLGEEAKSIPPTAYVPFSYGSRNCLGMVFAQLEAKLCVASLLLDFELRVSTTHELQYEHAVVTRPREGVYLVLTPHSAAAGN